MFNNRKARKAYVPITARHIAKFAKVVQATKDQIKDTQPKLKLK